MRKAVVTAMSELQSDMRTGTADAAARKAAATERVQKIAMDGPDSVIPAGAWAPPRSSMRV